MIRRTCLIALVPALVQLVPISSLRAAPLAAAGAQRSYSSDSSRPRPSGQWSMFMNGPLRRGRTPIIGAQSPTLVWRIPTETNYGGAAVGRDGTIYQGTDFGQLLAINPDGSIKWTMSGPYRVSENPAVMLDGRIVFVDEGGGCTL